MYPQGVCRIRKPAYAGNGCAIFLVFQTKKWGKKTAETRRRNCAVLPSYYVVVPRGTLLDQIGKGHAFQIILNHLIQPLPQRQRAAFP